MEWASCKFHVIRMNEVDSGSIEPMKDTVKNMGIREFQWIRLKKEHPIILSYKYTLIEDTDFESVDLKAIKSGRPRATINLKPLHDSPLPITTTKYENLQQLLQF